MTPRNSRVAIVVPAPPRDRLTEDEKISLRHLEHFLGGYDRYLICPEGYEPPCEGFRPQTFPSTYFGSVAAHTRLLLSSTFYAAFSAYEFILIYHLDALVFSSDLEGWCDQGFDYIGAPWLRDPRAPERGIGQVGNGGLSLRRVSSFLRVLASREYQLHPREYWEKYHAHRPLPQRLLNRPRMYGKYLRGLNGIEREIARFSGNEDKFWSKRGRHYDPAFSIAPAEVALRFAFECAPRVCFELNGGRLPFGCHAWDKYDRAFWEPYLLRAPATSGV